MLEDISVFHTYTKKGVRKGIPPPKIRSNILMDRQLPDGDLMEFSRNGSVAMTKREIVSVAKGWLSTLMLLGSSCPYP